MPNTVKKKIRLGTLFLFLMVLLSCGVGIFNLVRLKNDATEILKNNYESLGYCHTMQQVITAPGTVSPALFDSALKWQEANITEPGEQESTALIKKYYNRYRSGDSSAVVLQQIHAGIQQVLQLNMQAIEIKNKTAAQTASKALAYISILAALVFLVGFSFSYNFPYILTFPISSITEGLEEVSRKNYRHRINLNRKDEFGRMAEAFNTMTERLEYFENSNLNKLIFEKTRAEAVINSLKEASIGIDKNDTILFANNQALQLLGVQAKDIIGQPVSEVGKKNDLFRFLIEEQSTLPFKIVLDNRENYFTREMIDIVQEGAASKVIVLRNITSYKELDVAKTNFIATISHELKTPLASSDISIKLLEDERVGSLSAEQKELIENLRHDNQRMLRILSELLNMAQVETGKIQLEITLADPAAIMNNAIQAAGNAAKGKNILISKSYAEQTGKVNADADKTVWVLNNFLANAIKYSPENSSITARIQKKGHEIEFSITDQGQGIPEEYQPRLFERFFKVPGSKGGGTGLGLSISREFIEAQGGHIWVKSEIGSGSTFGFTLPAGE